jgi:hypothetical protein
VPAEFSWLSPLKYTLSLRQRVGVVSRFRQQVAFEAPRRRAVLFLCFIGKGRGRKKKTHASYGQASDGLSAEQSPDPVLYCPDGGRRCV